MNAARRPASGKLNRGLVGSASPTASRAWRRRHKPPCSPTSGARAPPGPTTSWTGSKRRSVRSTRRTVESLALLLDERIERLASTVHIDEVVEGDDDASRGQRRSSATCPAFNGTAPNQERPARLDLVLVVTDSGGEAPFGLHRWELAFEDRGHRPTHPGAAVGRPAGCQEALLEPSAAEPSRAELGLAGEHRDDSSSIGATSGRLAPSKPQRPVGGQRHLGDSAAANQARSKVDGQLRADLRGAVEHLGEPPLTDVGQLDHVALCDRDEERFFPREVVGLVTARMRSRSTLAGSSSGSCGTSSPRNALARIEGSKWSRVRCA